MPQKHLQDRIYRSVLFHKHDSKLNRHRVPGMTAMISVVMRLTRHYGISTDFLNAVVYNLNIHLRITEMKNELASVLM